MSAKSFWNILTARKKSHTVDLLQSQWNQCLLASTSEMVHVNGGGDSQSERSLQVGGKC